MKFNEMVSDTPPLTLFANCNYSIADLAPHSPFFVHYICYFATFIFLHFFVLLHLGTEDFACRRKKKVTTALTTQALSSMYAIFARGQKKNRQDLNINKRFLRLARAHSLFHCRPILFYFKKVRPQKVY